MDKEAIKIISDRLAELPNSFRVALTRIDVPGKVRLLAQRHGLHIDQAGALETEIMIGLLGIDEINELESNIRKEIGLSSELARRLMADVESLIIQELRKQMIELSSDGKARNENIAKEKIENSTVSRQEILQEIERLASENANQISRSSMASPEHKLTSPTVSRTETLDVTPLQSVKPPRTVDPYREPIV